MVKQKKGISLIVLVITIIVMIILAAAIILSLQSSGIIGKANEAKTKTNAETEKEQVNMAVADALLKGNNIGVIESPQDLEDSLAANGLTDATVTGDATNGYVVTVGENVYEVSGSGKVTLSTTISFTLNDVAYECEKGTTWEEAIASNATYCQTNSLEKWQDAPIYNRTIGFMVPTKLDYISVEDAWGGIDKILVELIDKDNDGTKETEETVMLTDKIKSNAEYITSYDATSVGAVIKSTIRADVLSSYNPGSTYFVIDDIPVAFTEGQTWSDALDYLILSSAEVDVYNDTALTTKLGKIKLVGVGLDGDYQYANIIYGPNQKYVSPTDAIIKGATYTVKDGTNNQNWLFGVVIWDNNPHVTDDMLITQ